MLSANEYATMSRVNPLPDDATTAQLLKDAEEDVNALTFGRIAARGFDALTAFQQDKVQLAVARQADFRQQYGEILSNPLASYSINGVSMSWDKSAVREYAGVQTCSGVISCLMQTGLMCGVIG